MALTKVSGGILDPGINVVGIVTATGFDGPFTGGSSKNITAGIITATELDLNGNVDIQGNLTVHGDQTTLNTTLREVELLRVDANNDNVAAGIITQTGAGDLLRLYDGTTQVVTVDDVGQVGIGSATPEKKLDVIGDTKIQGILNVAGITTLPKVNISNSGIQTSQIGVVLSLEHGSNQLMRGNHLIVDDFPSGSGTYFIQATEHDVTNDRNLVLQGYGGKVGIGSEIPSQKLDVIGTSKFQGEVQLSSGNEIKLSNNANTASATIDCDGGARLHLKSYNQSVATFEEGVGTIFYQSSGTARLTITPTGGVEVGAGSTIKIPDKMMHVGDEDTYLQFPTGDAFNITTGGTQRFGISGTTGMIAIGDNTNLDSSVTITQAQGDCLRIRSNASSNTFKYGVIKLDPYNNNALGVQIVGAKSDSGYTEVDIGGGIEGGYAATQLYFWTAADTTTANGTLRWKIDSSGHLLPGTAGAVNIGSATAEIGNVYIADDKQVQLGNSQDFKIYHSSSDNNSYITESGSADLLIQATQIKLQDASGTDYLRGFTGGAVYLHNAGNNKFETTSTGVLVTGEVAASQDYPNIRPTLNFNFAATKKLDPRITYSRTGPASFINEFGKLVIVAHNTPRFNHNPTTRECEGLLIEGQRTNRIIYSTDYTQFPLYQFSSYEGVISENLGTAPDGSLTDAFVGEGNNGRHTLYVKVESAGAGLSNSTKYAMSIFVKRVSDHSNERYCKLETASYSTWTHAGSSGVFDLSNGTEITSPGANITSGIETYPNGWFRIHFVSTTATVSGNTGFYLNMCNSSGNTSSITLTSSQGLFLYGTQMEAGSFPTSYIHTNGSIETRGYDQAFIDGEDFTDFYNPLESTVVCEFDSSNWITYNNISYERIWSFNNGSESDVFEMFKSHTNNNLIRYRVRDGAANVLAAANISYGTNTTPKMAFALKLNDAAAAVDGTIDGTTDSTIPMPTPDRLILGNDDDSNTNSLHGHIRRFMYYPVKLSDSQVVTLTS